MNVQVRRTVATNIDNEEQRLRTLLQQRKLRQKDPEKISLSTGSSLVSTTPPATSPSNDRSTVRGGSNSPTSDRYKYAGDQDQQDLKGQTGLSKPPKGDQVKRQRPKRKSRSRRRRDRRRMNREARSRGEPTHYDHRGGRMQPHRGSGGPGRWERSDWQRGDWRGAPPDRRPPYRHEYDYSDYRSRSRSRSPRDHRGRYRRSRSRSASSVSSHSRSPSRSRSYSNPRSRSRGREGELSRSRSRSDHDSRGEVDSNRSQSRSDRDRRADSGRRRPERSDAYRSRGGRMDESRGGYRDRDRPDIRRRGSSRSYSDSSSSDSSSSSSSSEDEAEETKPTLDESTFSKDQRTVFISQLVMRATEKDIRRYFKSKLGCKVKEVILLKDKRTGSHKGCAYVQMGRIEDVNKAVAAAGQPPDFQRFPILVKASEAEKNYVVQTSSSVVTASMMGAPKTSAPLLSEDGKLIESQKVYVGGLDPGVSEEHLFALFSQFGQLEKVTMQMDPATRTSRGFAFLSFRDPKEANLAIQTMSNQMLANRQMKTGWASQVSTVPGVEIVTSEEFPEDASARAQRAFAVLAQLTGVSNAAALAQSTAITAEQALDAAMGSAPAVPKTTSVPTVAEARANLVAQQSAVQLPGAGAVAVQPAVAQAPAASQGNFIGGKDVPTQYILVHNMFDMDQESGDGWPEEIKEEFEEECSKFGTLTLVKVMSKEPGGKIFAQFEAVEAAVKCAKNLAGRWFDKRQLRVDYVEEPDIPKE